MGGMKLLLAACALLVLSPCALAGEPPVPKLFRGIAADKGQWRMEILEAEREGRSVRGRMGAVTLCTDNLLKPRERRGAARASCDYRVEKDTPDEAVIESSCPERKSRVTLQREGANSVLMDVQSEGPRGPARMKARYTYEGACRAGQGTVTLDKDSEACRRMREQAAQMDPAKSCADAGAQQAACEARMRAAVEQLSAMCR
jgi:hypothetical protein